MSLPGAGPHISNTKAEVDEQKSPFELLMSTVPLQ